MSNSYTKLRYHLLFGTRGGEPLITPAIRDRLYRYVGGIVGGQRARLLEIGGMPDHVHLLLGTRPDQALADLVRLIKANASKEIGRFEPRFRWQRGYAAFSVSESKISALRRHIREQESFHQRRSLTDELHRLFEQHGLEHDTATPTLTRLRCHLVFATKDRLQLISAAAKEPLYRQIADAVEEERGSMLEIGGVADHLHLLLEMRPQRSVASTIKGIKGRASRWMNERFPPFAWQRGYGGFTVGESQVPSLRRYIRRQPEHHRTMSFADEFRILLQRHGLSWD